MAINHEAILLELKDVHDLASLEQFKLRLFGRKGLVTTELKAVGLMPALERRQAGLDANHSKSLIDEAIQNHAAHLQGNLDAAARLIRYDLTSPGQYPQLGHRHPVSMVLDELVDLFWQMGYQVAEGPEVETKWHNFEALLVGEDHPARDMQDTFYLEGGFLPRTHTSAVQIRYMMEHADKLPIRIVAPGKVYRNEDEDARHSWSFYQLEGLVVDKGISLSDLKGTLEMMLKGVLGNGTKIRLRSNYFPYTEPSVEMDATCVICHGSGVASNSASCSLCGGSGWLELGGAGMVHPQVLRNVGIDPESFSGLAFGFGPERIATIKYGVADVREFWRPNFSFLEQF